MSWNDLEITDLRLPIIMRFQVCGENLDFAVFYLFIVSQSSDIAVWSIARLFLILLQA